MKRWSRQFVVVVSLMVAGTGVAYAVATDPTMTSNGYSVIESEAGTSGDFTGQSSNYSFRPGVDDSGTTLGENAVGNSSSASYQSNGGFNTTAQPGLTFVVNTSSVDLGTLSASLKATGTATFKAINYTSYGYVITIIGIPPTNSGHALSPLATDTASSVGTEQFGVNTVLNTSAAVGANPVQTPVGPPTFGFGVAGDGVTNHYVQSDKWRFNSGETVASSPKSSGETDYTMTFLANMSTTTPGGQYTGNITLVATGTY